MNTKRMLGDTIKQYRKAMRMTQEELASEINVERRHISGVERGERGISVDTLLEICKKLNIGLDALLLVDNSDDSLRKNLIDGLVEHFHTMETVQLGFWSSVLGVKKK